MDDARVPLRVVITDFDMPFGSLIGFMIKVAIASIPATLILSVIGFVIFFIFGALLAACGMSFY